MQQHAAKGGAILQRASKMDDGGFCLALAAEIAKHHHEWYNGEGYPSGLAGDEIPLAARIVAVADVFDALISKRPYKDAWPDEKAAQFIVDRAGTQFDPEVVTAFQEVFANRANGPDPGNLAELIGGWQGDAAAPFSGVGTAGSRS